MGERDLLEEGVLRRALRLVGDERSPRFDPADIAAAAARRPVVGNVLVAAIAAGSVAYALWATVSAAAPTLVADALDGSIALVASAAVPALMLVDALQQPVVPASVLAALLVATAHELRQRKEAPPAFAS